VETIIGSEPGRSGGGLGSRVGLRRERDKEWAQEVTREHERDREPSLARVKGSSSSVTTGSDDSTLSVKERRRYTQNGDVNIVYRPLYLQKETH